ncbi:MAG: biotin transporter BioY [Lachnospiraceae bacterium]|nr:biotin transporter BioY [Lachnospiraceae bacterium]
MNNLGVEKPKMKQSNLAVKDMAFIALFTAVIVITSQISIPMPGSVPITMQTFAIILTGIVLGPKNGTLSVLVFLLLGAVGLPVFAGFTGGISKFVGPTGGFLFSFPLMALVIGLFAKIKTHKLIWIAIGIILGTLINFAMGAALFMALTNSNLWATLTATIIPFIPGTIIKCVAAESVGVLLKKRLQSIL